MQSSEHSWLLVRVKTGSGTCNSSSVFCCFVARSQLSPFIKCRQACCNLISRGDRVTNAMAMVKEEMGIKLSKAESLVSEGMNKMNSVIVKNAKMNVPTAGPKCEYSRLY